MKTLCCMVWYGLYAVLCCMNASTAVLVLLGLRMPEDCVMPGTRTDTSVESRISCLEQAQPLVRKAELCSLASTHPCILSQGTRLRGAWKGRPAGAAAACYECVRGSKAKQRGRVRDA